MARTEAEPAHESVLLSEVLELLDARNGGVFIDATLGAGGHAEAILEASPDAKVLGIDQDREALEMASDRLRRFGERFRGVHANFSAIASVAEAGSATGVLADLGVSSMQLDSESRGFSFRSDSPLDMRMDVSSDTPTAAELLATLSEQEIADVIYRYGEERHSRRIARRIVARREAGEPVTTTSQLAELVKRSVPHSHKDRIHPATRTFQALRIAVNRELEVLDGFVLDALSVLKPDGVLAMISFHSLEDRIVKRAFQRLSGKCECPPRIPQCVCGAVKIAEILTRRPIVPSDAEQARNPRARSAKLRACKKLNCNTNGGPQ